MKQFFKYVFASMIGAFLSILLLLFVGFLIVIGSIMSLNDNEKVEVKSHSILHIQLTDEIVERGVENPFEGLEEYGFSSSLGLNVILENIDKAADDPNIDGIYIDVNDIKAGLSTVEEIRNALIRFKKSNKFIYAYSEFYSQKAYYLASVADSVYLNPSGLLELKGFSSQYMFFKNAFDKLEIKPEIIRVGSFKSAVEPYMSDRMSDSNKLQVSIYLNSLFYHMVSNIATSRGMNTDSVANMTKNLSVRNATDAITYMLADRLAYKDEVLAQLVKSSNKSAIKDLNLINMNAYSKSAKADVSISKNKVAVIYASGEINSGNGNEESIGSETLSKAIRKARLDEGVKAIVLRVNSPGGSALASDVIWREVILAKKVKPFIVSMGDVAASGGYLIACAADTIVAQPTTITGSIGVFGILFNAENFFKNKLGITFDQVKVGEYADLGNYTKALTPSERNIIQNEVNRIYEDFTKKVSEGRDIEINAVLRIAGGRVYTGRDAQKIGLVDVLGNKEDAIDIAVKKANLSDYRIVNFPELSNPFQKFMSQLTEEAKLYLMPQEYKALLPYAKTFEQLKNNSGLQTRLLMSPVIE
jgi:protease IV